MPDRPDLVLGLVTHPNSRFRSSGEAVCERVRHDLISSGIRTDRLVSDRNDAHDDRYGISRSLVRRSARAQAELEARWRSRISESTSTPLDLAVKQAIGVKRGLASPAVLTRLLNIDYSHLRIWRHSLAVGAKATLVIEDDAQLVNDEIGRLVGSLMDRFEDKSVLVNCSESLDQRSLGVEDILQRARVTDRLGAVDVRDPRPTITNTVCANLYSSAVLEKLIWHVDHRGLVPVVPIDWRVNDFLIDNPNVSTWWLQPAPFVQGSMHLGADAH